MQVFVFRGGRVIERFELQTAMSQRRRQPGDANDERELLEIALHSSIPITCRRRRSTSLSSPTMRVLETWLSARAERKVRILVPQRGDKARWWNSRSATPHLPMARASTPTRRPTTTRWKH